MPGAIADYYMFARLSLHITHGYDCNAKLNAEQREGCARCIQKLATCLATLAFQIWARVQHAWHVTIGGLLDFYEYYVKAGRL